MLTMRLFVTSRFIASESFHATIRSGVPQVRTMAISEKSPYDKTKQLSRFRRR
jgi:hypothetical protein